MLATPIDTRQFQTLVSRLARAWNKQEAIGVATCFSTHAIFSNVTQGHLYTGREAIHQHIEQTLSGSEVHMVWHHLLFDEASQIGSGEYSIAIGSQHRHGIAMIKVVDGKITHWRAYETASDQGWQQFVGANNF